MEPRGGSGNEVEKKTLQGGKVSSKWVPNCTIVGAMCVFLGCFFDVFSRLIFDVFFYGFRVDFGTILGYVFDVFSLFCEVLYRSGALLKITFFHLFYSVI